MNIIILMLLAPLVALVAELKISSRHSIAIASISTFLMLVFSIYLLSVGFINKSISISQSISFIPILNTSFSISVGVIQLVLLLLASIVLFVASFAGNIAEEKPKLSSALIILFQFVATGIFTTGNLLIFFIFWDIGVITSFVMLNTLGSQASKRASINFLVYEIFASAMLLFAILLIYFYTPLQTFDITSIMFGASAIPIKVQELVMLFMFIAFMTNMPIFPMHLWMPDAYAEASTQGSMVLAGLLSKFGVFGMLIMFEILPIASHYSIYIAALAIFSSVYASFVLAAQRDIKKIVAYAAMVEMGIILLGISAANIIGRYGAVYGTLAQGLVIAFLFLVAGSIIHEFGERDMRMLKGIVAGSKASAYSFVIGTFAIAGMPLTASFIADLLIFIGAYTAFGFYGLLPLFAILLMASYFYYVINKSILSSKEKSKNVTYISNAQISGFVLLIGAILIFGFLPFVILGMVV
ncbi:MAG: complex I subunit 4 family protein [Candidatus Micrarchaeia archaeon]